MDNAIAFGGCTLFGLTIANEFDTDHQPTTTNVADDRVLDRAALADVQPFAVTGRYVNDVADAGDDVVRSVYGDAKYERLVAVKRAWDPDNVFRLNQNIRP